MKDVEYFAWQTPPKPGKRAPQVTRYKMTAEEAAIRLPGATPAPGSREVRSCPETPEELAAAMPGQAERMARLRHEETEKAKNEGPKAGPVS